MKPGKVAKMVEDMNNGTEGLKGRSQSNKLACTCWNALAILEHKPGLPEGVSGASLAATLDMSARHRKSATTLLRTTTPSKETAMGLPPARTLHTTPSEVRAAAPGSNNEKLPLPDAGNDAAGTHAHAPASYSSD